MAVYRRVKPAAVQRERCPHGCVNKDARIAYFSSYSRDRVSVGAETRHHRWYQWPCASCGTLWRTKKKVDDLWATWRLATPRQQARHDRHQGRQASVPVLQRIWQTVAR